MTSEQLKQLEDNLWLAADKLRVDSGLKASENATPILGLISAMYDQVSLLRSTNSCLKDIRDRLLPRLISGKLQLKKIDKQKWLRSNSPLFQWWRIQKYRIGKKRNSRN